MKTMKKRFQRLTKIAVISVLVVFALTANRTPQTAYAQIPQLINYQGKLTDSGGNPITGTRSITFRLYTAETAGNLLWDETHSSVSLDKGVFSVMLGGVSALNLPFDAPYWLGIKVGTDAEMTPRQRITSAGYAFRAKEADTIAGVQPTSKGGTGKTTDQFCNLAQNVEGVLPVANGGTGIPSSLTKVITYVGNGVDNRQIAHGLGAKPSVIIVTRDGYSSASAPMIWMEGYAPGRSLYLTNGGANSNGIQNADSTYVEIGTDGSVNTNTITYVMMLFKAN